jgi:superfamily II DNA or RNA helicase
MLYNRNDLRYIFFTGDHQELASSRDKHWHKHNLEDYLNQIPSYMFLPSFRGIPSPEVFLHKFKSAQGSNIYYCHSGLWKTVMDWCHKKDIQIQYNEEDHKYFKYTDFNMTLEEFQEYVNSWEITLTPYPYQLKAAWMILHYRQSLSQLATRAGKTLIAYIVFRYMLEHGAKKILMIVPNTTLVKQAVNDFDDYKEYFMSETVWADGQLVKGSNLTIGTFQSLVKKADKKSQKYDPSFFNEYDVVLVDEAHTLKCDSINKILNLPFMKNVKLKFGFSGSLPKPNTIDDFCCTSLMGPTIQDIRSKELMDGGFITPIEITQVRISHPEDDQLMNEYIKCAEYINSNVVMEVSEKTGEKKQKLLPKDQREFTIQYEKTLPLVLKEMKGGDQQEYLNYMIDLCKAKGSNILLLEQMMVHRDKKRLKVMEDLLSDMKKNCIVFAHHTEYLMFLRDYFKELFPNRPIYMITGQTTSKSREKIIKSLLTDTNAVLFASYGCVGTGLTLKNIDYGIFAQSFKSHIINKQALGRGLCLANDKDKYRLYDLVDDFPTKRLWQQGIEKMKLYKSEKFETHIQNV